MSQLSLLDLVDRSRQPGFNEEQEDRLGAWGRRFFIF